MGLAENFNAELHSIETRFAGGLSNTSTKKFDELIKIVAEITELDADKIYITAATSRASNLWNRLAQGKPLTQHFSFALGIIDASDLQGGISPASRFIGPGVGHYDAIALAVKRNSDWVIGAVLDSNQLSLYDKIAAAFPGVEITHEFQAECEDDEQEVLFAWYVGTTGNDAQGQWHDFSDGYIEQGDEYIEQGVWENGWDDKFLDIVNSIKIGDCIAIKSTFTQKYNLPFNNNGKKVGAMRIKAIGVVTGNSGDGKHIQVDWTRLDPAKTWYGPGTLRETIHSVSASDGYVKKQLLDFTFADGEQDYSICEECYKDDTDIDTGVDETIAETPQTVDETTRNTDGENVLLYGVPGAGKSWTIDHEYCDDDDLMERLVFHPDYMYSDFVGQILPVVRDDKVRYEFVPGPFVKILKKAYWNPTKSYYLIIEEINRGNAPAIFGEVFQLLDRKSKDSDGFRRGTSEYGITNANIAREVYGNEDAKVRIPGNLSIIGTMNTSDQNVFTLDTAFQRRWIMRMIPNSFEEHDFADTHILDTDVSWQQFCEAINDEILRRNNITSSEDKRLGAYFVAAEDLVLHDIPEGVSGIEKKRIEHRNARFAEKVIKYLWDDAFKFSHAETFDTRKYNSLELVIEGFMKTQGNNRFRVYHENLRKMILEGKQQDSNIVSGEVDSSEE